MTDPFLKLVQALSTVGVRFVVFGVWGANYYAQSGAIVLETQDRDLFLPSDPENLRKAWETCSQLGLELFAGREPLDLPRDRLLADRVVSVRALTTATDGGDFVVDLSLVMGSLDFERVWERHRVFLAQGIEVPVASLEDIVTSKEQAGRDKDKLFLATWAEELRKFIESERTRPPRIEGDV